MPAPYDKIASQWESLRKDFRPGESDYLDLLVESLNPDSLILDLGCGTGVPNAVFLNQAGHRIQGIDASEGLLEIARRNLPGSKFELGRLEDDAPLPGPFDGAICWDAIFHLDRRHHAPIFRRVAESLHPGAMFLLTSGGSANDPFTDTMFGETFSYDAHPPDETKRLLEDTGFEIVRSELLEKPTGGRNKGRLAIAARKL
ncbi:class I SAM-dependent DNA methyltransferase [Haloferula sp.]|uniref:class I SAM-dependent DNA methyltransferase n=1 Tax=Haloferula sp. TaxID=2497595 RepID=UPI00329D1863